MGWFPEQPGNGLDRVYHALIESLPAAGVNVTGLVTGSSHVEVSSNGHVRSTAPATAPLPKRLWEFRRTAQTALRQTAYDVIASHFAIYALPLLDTLSSHPYVVHFHGPWAMESNLEGDAWLKIRTKKRIERLVYQRADRFIVLSRAFRDLLIHSYGVDAGRIRIVPGGVDVDRFATGESQVHARERLGWPVDRPILFAVRRLVRRVGLENLLEAIAILRRQHPDVLLLIAGSGWMREELEERIDAADIATNVRLLGFVPDADLPTAYRAADLSIVPTIALEGFGLVAVESLAAGTPPLVTPIGGLPDIVRPLSDQLILEDASVGAVVDGIDAALRGSLSLPSDEECVDYARSRFAWSTIAQQTRAVYAEVC
jgi:glycosyltransferase involved in cell wall biosynthesis